MNKINPLVLISALVLILLIMTYGVSHLRDKAKENDRALFNFEESAKRAMVLKRVWNKINLEEKLKTIFGQNSVNDKGKTFEIRLSSLTRGQVNDMTKKVLSEAFEIEKFEIVTQADEKMSIVLEITK
jgi:CHASE1-domain containing sensor protein